MKTKLRDLLVGYFDRWWMPLATSGLLLAVVMITTHPLLWPEPVFITLRYHFAVLSFVVVVFSALLSYSALYWQLSRKRWKRALATIAAMLPLSIEALIAMGSIVVILKGSATEQL